VDAGDFNANYERAEQILANKTPLAELKQLADATVLAIIK
jgi:hypothetical protein